MVRAGREILNTKSEERSWPREKSSSAACRAVLKRFAPRRPDAIAAMAARFAAPAFPGDTIRVEVFETTAGVRFRAHALERDVLVLDRGEVGFR
jgi:acyl dehydratase